MKLAERRKTSRKSGLASYAAARNTSPAPDLRVAARPDRRCQPAQRQRRKTTADGSPTVERLGNAAATDGMIEGLGTAALQAGKGQTRAAIRTLWGYLKQVNPELRSAVINEAARCCSTSIPRPSAPSPSGWNG